MKIEIISPEKKHYQGEIVSSQFPGVKGSFQILNKHAPMLASLKRGNIVMKTKQDPEKKIVFEILSGVMQIENNQTTVLVDKVIK